MSQRREGFRLSPQQRRLWSLQQEGWTGRAQCVLQLEGRLDVQALHKAVQRLVSDYEILRTTFQQPPGIKMPLQVITDQADASWSELDLSQDQATEQEETVERFFEEEKPILDAAIRRAADAVNCVIDKGLFAAMNVFNKPTEEES